MSDPIERGKRIKSRMNDLRWSITKTAKLAGMTQPSLTALREGQTKEPKASTIQKLAKVLGVSEKWIMNGVGEIGDAAGISGQQAIEDGAQTVSGINVGAVFSNDELIGIREYSTELAAGAGAFNDSYPEERMVFYRRSFFREINVNPEYARRFKVTGNSMAPLILDGDYVLVDTTLQERIIDGAIYAFGYEGFLRVKRLYRPLNGGLTIKSDNPEFAEEHLTKDALEMYNFFIVGKVIERSGLIR